MSRRPNLQLPDRAFSLLLVEGGDERAVCQAVAGPAVWSTLVCWYGDGRTNLPIAASAAARDPHFIHVRSVGVVLDVEDDRAGAQALAARTLSVFGTTGALAHGVLSGSPMPAGAFFVPDGASHGSIETLCRRAVRNAALAACVDQLVTCAGSPHARQAQADKGWLKAYLGMTADPNLRFHQAFDAPDGIDPAHTAFDPLRAFLRAL